MPNTHEQYQTVCQHCKDIFFKKTQDYGTSWRILRLPSLTDQLWIKAQRIRSIQEKGEQKIADSIESEFIGIINYCVISLIQSQLADNQALEISVQETLTLYEQQIAKNFELLENKNHDYSEAWREMRISSMTDIMLMKLLRIKQIEDNKGKTLVSEGVESGYRDILNYAVFCLILMSEKKQ